MIAIKRLQSIMWIMIVALGALSAYLINLRVATERNAVSAAERQIYATRANIRYLELEFSARASHRQLEAWNDQDIRYSVPQAGQYLTSEGQLAMLERPAPVSPPAVMAPDGSAVAPEVMPAMAQAEPAAPVTMPVSARVVSAQAAPAQAMIMPVKAAPAPIKPMIVPVKAVVPTPGRKAAPAEPAIIRTSAPAEPVRLRPAVATVAAKADAPPHIVKLMDKADPARRRAMRLALLDKTLLGAKLDAATVRELKKGAPR